MNPDPLVSEKPATYTVSGTLKVNNIIAGKTLLGIVYEDPQYINNQTIDSPYIQYFTESYNAGEPFTITAKDVPTPNLPAAYYIEVGIFDLPDNPIATIYACATAAGGLSLRERAYPITGFSIAGYPIAERSYPIAERS
ncbi:unnamed protein product [Rhizophagus irregularis]|nr:unnamed protein product [Rhizophagus irregularis]